MFTDPEDVDARFNWRPGTARRLALRRRLPHVVLPDGSIRFHWHEVEALVRHVAVEGPPPREGACA
jgi:hypothetical protein